MTRLRPALAARRLASAITTAAESTPRISTRATARPAIRTPPVPALGACCFGIDYIVVTPGECTNLGGEYKGDGTVCDPNPCLPIATEKKTWGGVKKAYGN